MGREGLQGVEEDEGQQERAEASRTVAKDEEALA